MRKIIFASLSPVADDVGLVIAICHNARRANNLYSVACFVEQTFESYVMTETIFSSEAKLIATYLGLLYIKENPTLFYEFIVTFHASSVACSHSSWSMHQ